MSTSNLDLLNPAVRGGVLWLLSEVLAVELNVFQVPSAGVGLFAWLILKPRVKKHGVSKSDSKVKSLSTVANRGVTPSLF